MLDPQFWKSSPSTFRKLVGAVLDATVDRLHSERRSVASRANTATEDVSEASICAENVTVT